VRRFVLIYLMCESSVLSIHSFTHPLISRKAKLQLLACLCFAASHGHASPFLESITVTGTRQAAQLQDTPAAVGMVDARTLQAVNPVHSADVLNRVPGVFINQLGSSGQGTSAAIRQPITTNPVYLYLENGVPTRSPAFFNHNALYEVNVAQANGVEITKGPGSALYGSDAIGGVVNVLTDSPITRNSAQYTVELGEFAWRRGQVRGSYKGDTNALALRLDAMDSQGWRENNDYDRYSGNAIWQSHWGDFDVNTVYSSTGIDMHTGGTGLNYNDYKNHPEKAGNRIGFRDVSAQRLSSRWQAQSGDAVYSFTPYWRRNRLDYLATWTLNTGRLVNNRLDSQDAHINTSGDDSVGLQSQFKWPLAALKRGFLITGMDIDYGQGFTEQTYITRTDTDPGRYWLAYAKQQAIYDYRVNYTSYSPYAHIESDLGHGWRWQAGLRYDAIGYDYDNRLSTVTTSNLHNRPADTQLDLSHASPKLGLTYAISEQLNAYAAYRHGFRVPSEGQLFRAGATKNSTQLDAVQADSLELGLRGELHPALSFELSVYEMPKKDDILSQVDPVTGARSNANAGQTDHRGLETGWHLHWADHWQLDLAYAYNEHRFDTWVENNQDVSGKVMPNAPRNFTQVALQYAPPWLRGGRLEVEYSHQGRQFINAANSLSYQGYELVNLRASHQLTPDLQVYTQLLNAKDSLYAESVSSFGSNVSYTPGKPRTWYAGFTLNL
jgi:iron complex outermembrane recepter protein